MRCFILMPTRRSRFLAIDRPCLWCGVKMHVKPSENITKKYCSRKCLWQWHNKNNRKDVTCSICGKIFTVPNCRAKTARYCSKKCNGKGMRLAGSIVTTCKNCPKTLIKSPSQVTRCFCSVGCRVEWGFANRALETYTGLTGLRKAMLRRGLIKSCETCGFNASIEILGVHHKDWNHRNNELSNLAVLCPNCHSIAHSRHIVHPVLNSARSG